MTTKLNCWQFKNCGREKGGLMVELLGQCPVSTAMKYDGQNGGIGAGRACWKVGGNACHARGCSVGSTAKCQDCDFYHRVVYEEQDQVRHPFFGRSRPTVANEKRRLKLTALIK